MHQKTEIKTPEYFWDIAEAYADDRSNELAETKYLIDKDHAITCIQFASMLKHTAGSFAGITFQFQEWQIRAIVNIFGMKYRRGAHEGLRVIQRALFFMPKKNGKSEFAGVLHAIMFFLDDDKSKEQYSIATEIEQAKIIHKVFLTMLKQEPDLFDMVHTTVKPPRISMDDGPFVNEFQSLTSTADTKDGLRPSFLTIDEGHAHDTKDLYMIMTDGLAGRNQPLEIHLSTAGYNKHGFFYLDIYLYAKKIQHGITKDDRFYFELFEPDEEDKKDDNYWKNPEIWAKCNPNLGVSPTYSYMEGKIASAENSAQTRLSFLAKHLNVWVDNFSEWIKGEVWSAAAGAVDEEKLLGRTCYAGLDLASTTDIAAFVVVFPDEDDEEFDVLCRFWVPEENMRERVKTDKVPYLDWHERGEIIATDGNYIDDKAIEKQIRADCEKFNVAECAYDRWGSAGLVSRLDEDDVTTMVPMTQGFGLSPGIIDIEKLTNQKKLNNGGNKPLAWMVSNVVIQKNSDDKVKIDKKRSVEKVDGAVALAMAIMRAMVRTKTQESIYEKQGVRPL